MRIAIFHTTLPEAGRKPGGVEVAVHRLANALVDGGADEVEVCSLTAPPPDARYHHRRLFPRAPWLGRTKLGRWVVLPALLNAVRFDADVVHLHGDDWFYLRRPVPTVRTFHGTALGESRSATRLRRRIAYRVLDPLERWARRRCDLALAIGADAAERYRADARVDNGVDLDRFRPGPKAAAPTVLFVGTWDGRKRGRFAFERFVADVLPRVPSARLVVVAEAAEAHPAVEHLLHPDDDTLAARYREAWVLAYPSTYEGFGIPVLEALASGTAVVASPSQGVADVLAGGGGVLVGDASFGDAVARLLTATAEREALAAAGAPAAAAYAWPSVAAEHRRLYRTALATARRPRRRRAAGGSPSP
jgi:glycosyltransferase involved in cell wall biosynthesis